MRATDTDQPDDAMYQDVPDEETYDMEQVVDTVYDDLDTLVEETYEAVADDVADFFRELDAGSKSVVQAGYIDIEPNGDRPDVRYRSDQYRGSDTIPFRHVPVDADGWEEVVEAVYAPLEVARTQLEQARKDGEMAAEDAARIDAYVDGLSGSEVTVDAAYDLLSAVNSATGGPDDVHCRRVAYRDDATHRE